MGIKLGDLLKRRELDETELSGKIVAFDSYNIIYQFLSSIRTPEGYPLSTPDGRIISHLKGLFSRTTHFISLGVKPVFIFDGIPHRLKKGTLELRRERKERAQKEWEKALEEGDLQKARTKAQQTSRITDGVIDDSLRLLELIGVPVIMAPGEGEAQASFMCGRGDVYGTASQDFDSLLFGSTLLLRNLGVSGRRKLPGRKAWVNVSPEVISLSETLEGLGITREQLVDMAILLGTDFNDGVKGIGPKRAYSIISEFGDLETASKEKRIPLLEWDEIRGIFLEPDVLKEYQMKWKKPDEDGIRDFLVDELEFGRSGVDRNISRMQEVSGKTSQISLDSFV